MKEIFALPSSNKLQVEIHFQGRKVDLKFCIRNPEFFKNFPTKDSVVQERERILRDRAKGVAYTIIVCEDGVYTIET